VLSQILLSIISVDTRNAPPLLAERAFEYTAKRVAKSVAKTTFSRMVTQIIPFGFIIDYFFGPDRQVSLQAIENFSPDHDATYFRERSTWRSWFLSWFSPSWMKKSLRSLPLMESLLPWFSGKKRPSGRHSRHEM